MAAIVASSHSRENSSARGQCGYDSSTATSTVDECLGAARCLVVRCGGAVLTGNGGAIGRGVAGAGVAGTGVDGLSQLAGGQVPSLASCS